MSLNLSFTLSNNLSGSSNLPPPPRGVETSVDVDFLRSNLRGRRTRICRRLGIVCGMVAERVSLGADVGLSSTLEVAKLIRFGDKDIKASVKLFAPEFVSADVVG